MKKLKAMIRDRSPFLDDIKIALNLEGLGSSRNIEGWSIETVIFDKQQVQRWLRHQDRLRRRRVR
jgi:hypothetical protein